MSETRCSWEEREGVCEYPFECPKMNLLCSMKSIVSIGRMLLNFPWVFQNLGFVGVNSLVVVYSFYAGALVLAL